MSSRVGDKEDKAVRMSENVAQCIRDRGVVCLGFVTFNHRELKLYVGSALAVTPGFSLCGAGF